MFGVNQIWSDDRKLLYEKSPVAMSPDGPSLKLVVQREGIDVSDIIIGNSVRYREKFPIVHYKSYHTYR